MELPTMMEILILLPKTNCKECGEPTCMVFAVRVVEGVNDHTNSAALVGKKRDTMANYLACFHFE